MTLEKKIAQLEKQITKYLSLHNNPYDTSIYNEIAEKLSQLLQILNNTTCSGAPSTDDKPTTTKLSASVGINGENKDNDVKIVQKLLKIKVDGICGPKTKKAIQKFQETNGIQPISGLIEPNSPSWKKLIAARKVDNDTSTSDNPVKGNDKDSTGEKTQAPIITKLLDGIHKSEGGYVDDPNDSGGKTKYGIAEKGEWPKFAKMFGLNAKDTSLIKNITSKQADEYYIETRIKAYGLDKIKSSIVINAIFDQSVLTPGIVRKNIKKALNALDSSNKLPINNKEFTPEEIAVINKTNGRNLVKKFVDFQNAYYESIAKGKNAKFLRGWKNRTARLLGFKEDKSTGEASQPNSNNSTTIEVPNGWGLGKIAQEYNITIEQLKAWNADKLKTYKNGIQGFNAGEVITIKGNASAGSNTNEEQEQEEITSGGHIKPAWLKEAEKHIGKRETAKMVKDDPWIKLLFENLGAYNWAKSQTVNAANWCAAFVSYCLKNTGQSPLSGFDGMRALTYASKYGKTINRPVYGAIAVVKRGEGGHIGFVVGYNKKTKVIQLLGGNQSNAVNIKSESREIVAYKVPSSWNVPEQNYLD